MSNANVTYETILSPNQFVTGVRQDAGTNQPVVLTGNYQPTQRCATAGASLSRAAAFHRQLRLCLSDPRFQRPDGDDIDLLRSEYTFVQS